MYQGIRKGLYHLKSEILSQERNVLSVKAEFEAGEVDRTIAKTVRELSSKVNIKGFRKGHVPRKTLELYFGREAIYKETLERIAQEALDNIVGEYDLDLIAEPKVNIDELKEGQPLALEFTFEVRPEVTLPDIGALTAEKIIYGVKDAEVEEAFAQILESNAKMEPLSDDRPATEEDIVEVEYSSYSVEGEELKELDRDQKSTLSMSNLRKDIADAVLGKKPAEEFSFEIKLEDDYPDPRMAGKTVRYDMEILQFMKRVVPEASDEVVKELSKGKFETVEAIKEELRRQMEQNAGERSDGSLRESAIKALSAAAEVDVPETMIDRQYDAMRKEQEGQLSRDLQLTLDEYLAKNNLNVEEFEANLRKRALEIVRNTLVLDALAERDSISFTSDELNEEILNMATAMRVNPQQLADALSKNRDEFSSVAMRVRTRNTINHLASLVQAEEMAADETPAESPEDKPAQETPEEQ